MKEGFTCDKEQNDSVHFQYYENIFIVVEIFKFIMRVLLTIYNVQPPQLLNSVYKLSKFLIVKKVD